MSLLRRGFCAGFIPGPIPTAASSRSVRPVRRGRRELLELLPEHAEELQAFGQGVVLDGGARVRGARGVPVGAELGERSQGVAILDAADVGKVTLALQLG